MVGWGLDENSRTAEVLKMVKMPIVDQQTCLWSNPDFFSRFTSPTTFCAGFKNGNSQFSVKLLSNLQSDSQFYIYRVICKVLGEEILGDIWDRKSK